MSHSTAYVDAFLTKKPKEGIHIVQSRLKDIMTLDTELAEYFKERAEIEDNYAKSLAKASKRLYTTDPSVLGHFAPVWDLLLKEYNQIANCHSEMAYKITQQIERPLRSPPSDDYDKLQQMEPFIHSLESKNKLSSVKGSIFKKSQSSKSNWENEGVDYLNLSQGIDEARLNRLKSSVQQFEQIQCDQLQKRLSLANTTLIATDKFDIQHDIQDFCSERGKGLMTIARPSQPRNSVSHDSLRSTTSSTNKFKSVFMKKKKHSKLDGEDGQSQDSYSPMDNQFATDYHQSPSDTIPVAPIMNDTNNTHLVDSEGYSVPTTTGQFPTIASDISSRNTSDDVDSDFQSLKLNQKLQINIKDSALKEESSESNESFTKVASMLRERTPTITRKPRGRRESSMLRSQTDSSLYSTYNDSSNNMNRSSSMLSMSSMDTGNSNPFLQQQQPMVTESAPYTSSPQLLHHSPVTLVDSPMTTTNNSWQLQPILEDQNPEVHISIHEKTSMIDAYHRMHVKGQVSLTYTGSTQTPILLAASHLEGLQQLIPNPQYISVATDHFILDTSHFPQGQPVPCFTYEVELNGDGRLALPLYLSPSWKCTDGVTYLMIKHSQQQQQSLDKLKGSIHVFYNHVTNVQSTPQGIWDMSKNRLTWHLKDLIEQYHKEKEPPRLLAKFFLDEDKRVGTSQPVYFNYLQKDVSATGFSIRVLEGSSIKQTLETLVQSENIILH
ncbi:Muniscin C-terminal mu homology domain-containing protein [Mucor mucedo]|uniref:Muniscin C-terminal mu homology domain-containing protein n=1 Tax=Mucor mucedo TaxID=29922 RepID=UPI00221FCF53|nr:Muniscin C-terminal mu homology domain-containing protein [Mucor mucedo]KAI7896030.1 Muniscin C-terminal mu homology domain-containing protein [Mucor mucedo]